MLLAVVPKPEPDDATYRESAKDPAFPLAVGLEFNDQFDAVLRFVPVVNVLTAASA